MKRLVLSLVLVLSLSVVWLSGCTGLNGIVGVGEIVTKQYDFKDFTAVEVSNAIDVRISAADTYSVSVSTYGNILDRLEVSQTEKTLIIRLPFGSFSNSDIKVDITMPVLTKLNLSGASKGTLEGFKSANDFESHISGASELNLNNMESSKTNLDISGASKMKGYLKAGDLILNVSGASRCELEGSAEDMKATITGASTAEFGDLQVNDVNIELSGASRADISTNGKLDLNISGASTLSYAGEPTLGKVDVSGASKLVTK